MTKYSRRTAYTNTISKLLIFFLVFSSAFSSARALEKAELNMSREIDAAAFGIILILLGMALFVLELKITSYGMLTLGGVISLILGSIMLMSPKGETFVAILNEGMLAIALLAAVFLIFAASKVMEAKKKKPSTGRDAIVGETGTAEEELNPEGEIMVKGELWKARAKEGKKIEKGRNVKIVEVKDLALAVEEIREEEM